MSSRDNTQEWIGLGLLMSALFLTTYALARIIIKRTKASKFYLFPVINALIIITEINTLTRIFVLVVFSDDSTKALMITKTINDFFYLLAKPIILYLAYLRCKSVFKLWNKWPWLHYLFFLARIAQIFSVFVGDIIYIEKCNFDMANPRCNHLAILKTIRDAYAPVPRVYYMISETIFFVILFKSLRKFGATKAEQKIMKERRFQAVVFTIDLTLILGMILYRILNIFKSVPTYDYADEFCTAFTVYNMTRFGLTLPNLFKNAHGGAFTHNSKSQTTPPTPTSPDLLITHPGKKYSKDSGNGSMHDYESSDNYGAKIQVTVEKEYRMI
ncbi:1612_t:CDS:1 [Ambispora gerdemannii]|uniref:1612_t:CDS:1 n=1 Tax=Ambispora gerdemannii TaxID=144530 RepID=A0A9N9AS15_9GLOM|nr:1612_t:CDS:1 [Ambispora gerdemannii]